MVCEWNAIIHVQTYLWSSHPIIIYWWVVASNILPGILMKPHVFTSLWQHYPPVKSSTGQFYIPLERKLNTLNHVMNSVYHVRLRGITISTAQTRHGWYHIYACLSKVILFHSCLTSLSVSLHLACEIHMQIYVPGEITSSELNKQKRADKYLKIFLVFTYMNKFCVSWPSITLRFHCNNKNKTKECIIA